MKRREHHEACASRVPRGSRGSASDPSAVRSARSHRTQLDAWHVGREAQRAAVRQHDAVASDRERRRAASRPVARRPFGPQARRCRRGQPRPYPASPRQTLPQHREPQRRALGIRAQVVARAQRRQACTPRDRHERSSAIREQRRSPLGRPSGSRLLCRSGRVGGSGSRFRSSRVSSRPGMREGTVAHHRLVGRPAQVADCARHAGGARSTARRASARSPAMQPS